MHPLVLIEFNELSPVLLDRWMRDGHLPNFKKFYDSSLIYITKPDIAEPAYLEPWIQWYSLHTGLPYQTHNVFHLTDGPRAEHKDIWSVFLENGFSVFTAAA